MRWESLAIALFTQALQVGLKAPVSAPLRSEAADVVVGAECHCTCHCFEGDRTAATWSFGGVIGALGASAVCWCKGSTSVPSSPHHHRRRGHGVIVEPPPWTDPGRFLQ